MYSVRLSKHAIRDMDTFPDAVGRRVYSGLRKLGENPRPPGCKKIRGEADTYRIRIGNYRVLYDVDDGTHLISVVRVQHRKDAYRDL